MADVALRAIEDPDLDELFEQMRDPASVWMAAFTWPDPDDRAAFDRRMARSRTSPGVTQRAITRHGRLVGSIAGFVVEENEEKMEITYWVDRSVWGQGIAGSALALFLDVLRVRPLYARAAGDNVGSLKVLRRAGFTVIGTEISHASARGGEIEETILCLGHNASEAGSARR